MSAHDDDPLGPLDRGPWRRPPDRIRERVRQMPGEERLAATDAASTVDFRPDDVRAAGDALAEGEDVVVTRSHEKVDLTVSIRPPDAEGVWRISGRAWLVEPSEQPLRLALVHDDHVLVTARTPDGEYFELEDVLPAGWRLEIHLPDGTCLRVDDPRGGR